MEAGIELDALIAAKVIGWKEAVQPHPELPPVSLMDLYKSLDIPMPRYSTDIAAAWEVVEKVKDTGYGTFTIERNYSPKGWRVGWPWGDMGSSNFDHEAISDSLPHAICLAALQSVGIQVYTKRQETQFY